MGLEIDHVTFFEEYLPYGATTYGATTYGAMSSLVDSSSKYRFANYCRYDTITYRYETRFYVAWLSRWVLPDPLNVVDGLNLRLCL
jgi:RHS repeat-associated protein